MTDERGVIYMAWGENAIRGVESSVGSLRRFEPELPVLVVGDAPSLALLAAPGDVSTRAVEVDPFDPGQRPGYQFLAGRVKPLLAGLSPFERTLYVDADSQFVASPAEGFRLLDRWDFALAETPTRSLADGIAGPEECAATAAELGTRCLLYHNSGMLFWRRCEAVDRLFELWAEEWRRFGGWDEQVALLRALLRSDALYLTVPHTWNSRGEAILLQHLAGSGTVRARGLRG